MIHQMVEDSFLPHHGHHSVIENEADGIVHKDLQSISDEYIVSHRHILSSIQVSLSNTK